MRYCSSGERGQALILVIVALSIFAIGAIGLGIDGANMYSHRQMAQTAADAAALAGMMSIFDGTNTTATTPFTTTAFLCTTSDNRTPCVYAARNGFGTTANDSVTVAFPTTATGVSLSGSDPTNMIKVTVQRTVNTGLIRFLGPSTSTIQATAIAAILDVVQPVPILVTHPTLDGSFRIGGNPLIQICGGPLRSIQVNSNARSPTALTTGGTASVDLSKAGPRDDGTCSTGTGADFGVFGGPASSTLPSWLTPAGANEHYIQPSSPIRDPLATVPAPPQPANAPAKAALANGVSGCPAVPKKACMLYAPGNYTGGINVQNETAVFMPGLYYMDGGGFQNAANGDMFMATGFADSTDTGGQGMLVYNHGSGTFNVGANSDANLVGSSFGSTYKGILFFNDRNAPANTGSGGHLLGGGGNLVLKGTIYFTNTIMTSSIYQNLRFRGNSGNTTQIQGEIIVSALDLGGGGTIQMNLDAGSTLKIRQVALIQ